MDESELHIEYLGGSGPVQAWGTIGDKPFYFRARHDRWSFAVALDPNVDPADIARPEQGFYREQPYGQPGSHDASNMPSEVAASIIRQCANEYASRAD